MNKGRVVPDSCAARTTAPVARNGMRRAVLYVLIGSAGIQTSSALSAQLFGALGPLPVSSLRMIIAAALLIAVVRPTLRGRSTQEWAGIVVYGMAMSAMNLFLYSAIDRIPLGVAVTLDFLGPCVVALALSRRWAEVLWAVLALAGVILIAGPGGYFDLLGFAFGLAAGACFAVYTLFAEKVGKAGDGLSGLALSVTVAAVLSAPFGIGTVAQVSAAQWAILAISAGVGVAIPYTVDTLAARVSSARVVGTLFSIDPAMGSLIGWIALGQSMTPGALAGIGLVIIAGAAITWTSAPDESAAPQYPADSLPVP